MNQQKELLYKYRSLKDWSRIVDILINHRLYATSFNKLNDPMEGAYRYNSNIDIELRKRIREEMKNTPICSLSKESNIGLMWTHYADEGRGCCIEVEVTAISWNRVPIIYDTEKPLLDTNITDILSHKGKAWSYEQEVRYLKLPKNKTKDDQKPIKVPHFLTVNVTKLILGYKATLLDCSLLNKLITLINNNKTKGRDDIQIERIKKQDVDFGY